MDPICCVTMGQELNHSGPPKFLRVLEETVETAGLNDWQMGVRGKARSVAAIGRTAMILDKARRSEWIRGLGYTDVYIQVHILTGAGPGHQTVRCVAQQTPWNNQDGVTTEQALPR